jgi:Domain of unknown function (DUF4440)
LLTTGVGNKYNKTELNSNLKNVYSFIEITTQDEKIQQLGNMAIVSGSFIQKDAFKQAPNSFNFHKGVFNYIYYYVGESWKLASSQHSDTHGDKVANEAAIKAVIIAETQAYVDGHPEKITEYWSNKPSDEFQSQQIVPLVGQPFAKAETLTKLTNAAKTFVKKQDIKVEREDFEIRINKDLAWATYTQKAIANGAITQTIRETRILERINGDWKIVYVGEQGVK